MTLEQVMERLIKQGMPEDEARTRAVPIIANMDHDKTNVVNEIQNEIEKRQQEYNAKKQDNIRNGGLFNPELEKIQKTIDELYKELDHELGIEPYKEIPKALPEGKDEIERRQLIERYQNDLPKMKVNSPMYNMTKAALDKLLKQNKEEKEQKEKEEKIIEETKGINGLIERYQKDLEKFEPGSPMYKATKATLDKLLEQKEKEENSIEEAKGINGLIERYQKDLENFEPGSPMYKATKATLDKLLKQKEENQNEPSFGDAVRKMVKLDDLAPMMNDKKNTKNESTNVKDEKPDGVEYTPLDDIPAIASATTIEEPKPSLLNRAKEWLKSNKRKVAMIVGAVAILGIATAAIVHYLTTGDSSTLQNTAQTDLSSIVSHVTATIDAETARQVAEFSSQVAPNTETASIADLISKTINTNDGSTLQIASNAYDALSGNLTQINPSVQPGVPVTAFDIANNTFVPLETLKNMSPDQMQNISVLMGDTDLAGMLKDVTEPNQINNIISSNISHAQGYTQIPAEIVEQLSQGGRVL